MLNTTTKPMKVAILGGSFDPLHMGHLHIAKQVLDMEAAKEVWFIPSGNHRFKQAIILLDFDARISLIQRAIATEPRFKCLDLDRAGMGDGSTYDIMVRLQKQYPQHSFSFLIGMDNLAQLPQWYNFNWLKDHVRFLVSVRPGYSPDQSVISQLKDFAYLNCKPLDVSSTNIRAKISSGLGIQGLVPHQLLIEITKLYKELLIRR
jgi:nicotinate-nucleotide adenylyltransferase